mmetsp:Transcript_150541/g.484024  ORF Transcript_150541/g.484024 Transcript_150541/m.484024 type:complete len:254 (-) Transcript_150541:96-857(-)|eukprot:CAMPEP_0203878796 /NCGR_PEP_ID=MMETSP0359-20131031/23311_1 /ASSEMBLY_ACC=CAM_ASM_000338 /TAXON_ID=268821 /ORGANISM="Scrippsiella Hangoei, Strain SHTV-5" /LENGTH=253 /DNA_ID=CAMNT_0050798073 /DNA_START=53 /DNA_END=814 /DNA_ORIENTATION=-
MSTARSRGSDGRVVEQVPPSPSPTALLRFPMSDKELDLKAVNTILSSAQSREKALKIVQYSAKLLAYCLVRAAGNLPSLGKHFEGLAKNLSTARRFFKFFRWFKHFEDIADARAEKDSSFKQLLYLDVAANLVADVAEDITSLEKVGILKKGVLPKRTEYYSNWCQLVLAVVEIMVSRIKARRAREKASAPGASLEHKRKNSMAQLELSKYYSDLVKAFWDCELSFANEFAFILSGLFAALVSTHKYALKVLK